MLNKLFGRRYAKFDPAIDQLTSDDEKAIDQITADIRDYIGKSDTVSKINYHTRDEPLEKRITASWRAGLA